MIRLTLPDNLYGAGTDRIRCILTQVQAIRWFEPVAAEVRIDPLVKLVRLHLDSLLRFDNANSEPVVSNVQLLEGDWSVLHQGRWGLDPYDAWGDRWKESDVYLGRMVDSLNQSISSSPEAQVLLRPPLWPVEKHSNICGVTLIAEPAILEKIVNLSPGGRDWCVAWALLCKAEAHAWNALLWELASGVRIFHRPNPFQYCLDLYELGTFPMGWAGTTYHLYCPKIARAKKKKEEGKGTA